MHAESGKARFAGIDLLRGIACLSVLLFHYLSRGPAGGWMQGLDAPLLEGVARYGYLGVHLFFIISGFVILWSIQPEPPARPFGASPFHGILRTGCRLRGRGAMLHEFPTTPPEGAREALGRPGGFPVEATPRSFIASRVARLYPAFWVAVPLTALVVWWGQDARLAVPLSHAIGNLTMFAHWLGLKFVDDAYWSLAVELHFYIYVWLVLRFKALRWLEALLAAWLLVSAINWLRPMYPVEFWLNAKWAPFFAAGCVLFRVRSEGWSRSRNALLLASWLLAVAYAWVESRRSLSATQPFNPVVVASLVTLMFAAMTAITQGWLRVPGTRWITLAGALTYPVYLLHENIGYVLHAALRGATGNAWLALLLVVASVLTASWCIHRGVERPLAPRLRRLVDGKSGNGM
ncbi:acyltransferase [Viridibacterium curvum]|uniref:Acyltransferase n=1 Tax=Viridibacterium curvum TaxID=1101404 RepID=A0ABP9QPH8_9RHOO